MCRQRNDFLMCGRDVLNSFRTTASNDWKETPLTTIGQAWQELAVVRALAAVGRRSQRWTGETRNEEKGRHICRPVLPILPGATSGLLARSSLPRERVSAVAGAQFVAIASRLLGVLKFGADALDLLPIRHVDE